MTCGLKRQHVLGEFPFAGTGTPTGFYENKNQSLFAVSGFLGIKTHYKYRVVLYRNGTWERLAVLDLKYEIQDVSFHPKQPVLAIAAGSYDGGFLYEGELFVWNFETDRRRSLLDESREVVFVEFDDAGNLTFALGPRDDMEKRKGVKTQFYRIGEDLNPCRVKELPVIGEEEFDQPHIFYSQSKKEAQRRKQQLKEKCRTYEHRENIWDVKWLHDAELVCTGEHPFLEKWSGQQRAAIREINGKGRQLFLAADRKRMWINMERMERHPEHRFEFPHSYFARFDTATMEWSDPLKIDVPFAAIQNANDMFFIQPLTVPGLDERKETFVIDGKGDALLKPERNWELVADDRPIVVSNPYLPDRVHHRPIAFPNVDERPGFPLFVDRGLLIKSESGCEKVLYSVKHRILYREKGKQGVLWQRVLDARVTALAYAAYGDVVVFALDNGTLGLLSAADGTVLDLQNVQMDGGWCEILSLDVYADQAAVGTADGLILLYQLQ